MNYLLLDTKNLLEPVGKKSKKELLKELKLTNVEFSYFLINQELYQGRYALVEEDFDEEFDESFGEENGLVCIDHGDRYDWYLSPKGKLYSFNKKSREYTEIRLIVTKNNEVYARFHNQKCSLKDLMAKTFFKNWKSDSKVKLVNPSDPLNLDISNLVLCA